MEEIHIFNAFKKLFKSLVLERYPVEGEVRVFDFSTDTYVNVEEIKDFPQTGAIHVIYDLDLSRFHECLDNYDSKYAMFFQNDIWDESIEKVLKYLPELPLYHDVYFRRTNVDKLLEEIPTMINNINHQYNKDYKNLGKNCKLTDIKYEDEGVELSRRHVTSMIVHNSCENTTLNELFAQTASEMYPDMLWLIKTY